MEVMSERALEQRLNVAIDRVEKLSQKFHQLKDENERLYRTNQELLTYIDTQENKELNIQPAHADVEITTIQPDTGKYQQIRNALQQYIQELDEVMDAIKAL